MFRQIDTMRMARELGAHAATRQRLTASNVANADTPGFRARDLRSFQPYRQDIASAGLKTTRPDHLAAASRDRDHRSAVDAGGEPSPNGNTVSLEDEMVRAADAKRQFDLSLAIVQSGMTIMRTALGRRG